MPRKQRHNIIPSPLATTACALFSWPCLFACLLTTAVARSGPLYTYLYRYLTADMDEHISMRCVFGSTKMRVWWCRYSGYLSTSQRVSSLKERGYLFLHFPYSMHYALRKFGPHGPCTKWLSHTPQDGVPNSESRPIPLNRSPRRCTILTLHLKWAKCVHEASLSFETRWPKF